MPSAAEVHVWWASTDQLTEQHRDLLDRIEQQRWTRLRRTEDRDRFTLGSTLVRSLVAELDGTDPTQVALDRACPRCDGQHGPVTAPGRAWRCSVSHSGAFGLAVAVAAAQSSAVGVDLETRCPPDWRHLVTDLLSPGEQVPGDEAGFLATWVRKEAVLKATGEGLSRPMSTVDVTTDAVDSLRLLDVDITHLRGAGAPPATAAALAVGAQRVRLRWERARI